MLTIVNHPKKSIHFVPESWIGLHYKRPSHWLRKVLKKLFWQKEPPPKDALWFPSHLARVSKGGTEKMVSSSHCRTQGGSGSRCMSKCSIRTSRGAIWDSGKTGVHRPLIAQVLFCPLTRSVTCLPNASRCYMKSSEQQKQWVFVLKEVKFLQRVGT